MSTKDEIFEYVTHSPENTNPAVLKSMLEGLSGGGEEITVPLYNNGVFVKNYTGHAGQWEDIIFREDKAGKNEATPTRGMASFKGVFIYRVESNFNSYRITAKKVGDIVEGNDEALVLFFDPSIVDTSEYTLGFNYTFRA